MTPTFTLFAAGAASYGAAATLIAQGLLDEVSAVERLLGGGALVGSAVMMVRWALKLITEVRTNSTLIADELRAELDALRTERTELRSQLAAVREAYAEERGLRIAAERHLRKET